MICKNNIPKKHPSGGDNLDEKEPEREYECVANVLLSCVFVM